MQTALAGVGPTCRAFFWCSDPNVQRKPLPQELMHSFRDRMCDCMDVSPTAPVQVRPPGVRWRPLKAPSVHVAFVPSNNSVTGNCMNAAAIASGLTASLSVHANQAAAGPGLKLWNGEASTHSGNFAGLVCGGDVLHNRFLHRICGVNGSP